MPAWKDALSPQDTWALVNLIKSFSPRFRHEPAGKPVEVNPIPSSPKLIERGKALFTKHKCVDCHGESLKGDGKHASSPDGRLETRRVRPRSDPAQYH